MWIDLSSSTETASELETRLGNLNAKVEVSSHVAYSIAYSANGVTLRQKETVTASEFRGLTQAAAEKLVTASSDATSSQTWYKAIGDGTEYAVVTVTSGSKTDYIASRANEADGWHVTKTVTAYEAYGTTGWSTTRPSVSTNGMIVSQSSRKTFLTFTLTGTGSIYQNESVVVREYPFLTLAEAQTKCGTGTGGLTATNSLVFDEKIATSWSTSAGVTGWKNVTIRGGGSGGSSPATDTVTDMRYEGVERGWTVTATSTTYWGSTS